MNPEIAVQEQTNSPDLFSRGTLDLTYKLLRRSNPSLALIVRNLLMGHLQRPSQQIRYTPRINITLDAGTIGRIVAALTILGQMALENKEVENGKLLILRSLIEDWAGLAEWLIQCSNHYSSRAS